MLCCLFGTLNIMHTLFMWFTWVASSQWRLYMSHDKIYVPKLSWLCFRVTYWIFSCFMLLSHPIMVSHVMASHCLLWVPVYLYLTTGHVGVTVNDYTVYAYGCNYMYSSIALLKIPQSYRIFIRHFKLLSDCSSVLSTHQKKTEVEISKCKQFSVIRPHLTGSQCHPEEGAYTRVNEETWRQHMNELGQIEDDYHLRKVRYASLPMYWS